MVAKWQPQLEHNVAPEPALAHLELLAIMVIHTTFVVAQMASKPG